MALPALLLALALSATASRADEPFETSAWTSPVGVEATICQGNGGSRSHEDPQSFYAWDYDIPEGTPVMAARDGTVVEVVDHHTLGGAEPRFQEKANRVVLKHADGLRSVYAHLRPGGVRVRVGEKVIRGERIGTSGNTGFSSGPHLHFAVVDSQGVSVPVHFADFEMSDGVPWERDRHGAAPKPVLPQKEIDACRVKLRAATAALARGWPEVGLLVIDRHSPRRAHADHPLNREVAGLEARCRRAIEELAGEVLASPAPDTRALFRFVRASVAADQARAPRELRDVLRRARRALPGDAAKEAAGMRNTVTRLVKGMAKECLGQEGAAQDYAALLKYGKAPVRAFAQARLDALVDEALTAYRPEVTRLEESARAAGPQDEDTLLRYAEETLDLHRALLEQAARVRTERDAEVKAALERLRAVRKEIATLLG